jgi:hypothetical protein
MPSAQRQPSVPEKTLEETLSTYFIRTHSGRYFDLQNPSYKDIDLSDIAYALSHICRFTGHAGAFTVAEHSINVASLFTDPVSRLSALLHDAAEAYVGDISTPLKRLLNAGPVEDKIIKEIEKKFGVKILDNWDIERADLQMLLTEAHNLMDVDTNDGFWPGFVGLPDFHIDKSKIMSHRLAEMMFLATYKDIQDEFVKNF